MATYLVFFGNSQGFLSYFFDRREIVNDFNDVIKDFNLLESRVFTIDSVDNKEILSRYSFVTNKGKQFSLLKLYSFAQAYNIPRIEGCIFGVGIISDSLVSLSSKNINLLKVAKDNFSKLSLNGQKFNKSDFLEDSIKIWNAIVHNENGNLIDSIDLEPPQFKNQNRPVAFNVNSLFKDAIELNDYSKNFDIVYFSEDFDHLRRAQNKAGADYFSIYVKENNKYIHYKEQSKQKEPVPLTPEEKSSNKPPTKTEIKGDISSDLIEDPSENQKYKLELNRFKSQSRKKSKIFLAIIIVLTLVSIFSIYRIYHLQKQLKNLNTIIEDEGFGPESSNEDFFWNTIHSNTSYYDTLVLFIKDLKYIAEFNPEKSFKDSAIFKSRYTNLNRRSSFLGIENLDQVEMKYANSLQYINDSLVNLKITSQKN